MEGNSALPSSQNWALGHGDAHPPFTQPPHMAHSHHLPQVQFLGVHLVVGLVGEACLAPELVPGWRWSEGGACLSGPVVEPCLAPELVLGRGWAGVGLGGPAPVG